MTTRTAHTHTFSRSKPTASVETCRCGKFRFTEHAGPPITEVKPTEHKTAQHTPGPWKISHHGQIVACDVRETMISTVISDRDGALIAAAPELLEALKRCQKALAEQFKTWCKDHKNLAMAVIEAQAYAELKRKQVNAYIKPIFDSYQFREDCTFDGKHMPSGKLLESPEQLYTCDDPLIPAFYEDCDKAHRAHGFTGPKGHCPALVAENLLMQAQNALLDCAEELTGIEADRLYGDNRKKMLKLLLGACLKSEEAQ